MFPPLSAASISSANWSIDLGPLVRTTSLYCRYNASPPSGAASNTVVQNGSSIRANAGIEAILVIPMGFGSMATNSSHDSWSGSISRSLPSVKRTT